MKLSSYIWHVLDDYDVDALIQRNSGNKCIIKVGGRERDAGCVYSLRLCHLPKLTLLH